MIQILSYIVTLTIGIAIGYFYNSGAKTSENSTTQGPIGSGRQSNKNPKN